MAQLTTSEDSAEGGGGLWHAVLTVPTYIAAIVLFALMTLTFVDVVMRSAFSSPITGGAELTQLSLGIIVFSALPMVSWKGGNVVVDLIDPFVPPFIARIRDAVMDLICGAALIWPTIRVWELAERSRGYGDVTQYLHVPQFYIGWFIAFFTGLTAVTFILRGVVRPFSPAQREREKDND